MINGAMDMNNIKEINAVIEAANVVATDGIPEGESIPLTDECLSHYLLIRVDKVEALRVALSNLRQAQGNKA